jgi:hypothetical protein
LGFIQLVLLEALLLFSAGMIFFGGIRGTLATTAVISGLNFLVHSPRQFWHWEIPLLIGGIVGAILLLILGKMARRSQMVGGLVGGLIGLVLFGAFMTPMAAVILWVMVVGLGLIPKKHSKDYFWEFAPTILRLILSIGGIVFGNFMTF